MDLGPITVAAQGITVSFAGLDVVKAVDLVLSPGEIHAIVGENGAGKSSLAKAIAGVYRPRLGNVLLNGTPTSLKNPRDAIRQGIALIHQEPLTFPELDVTENIFAGHHPGQLGWVNWKDAYARAKEILDQLGVKLNPRARVAGLSVAQQQMVELAAAMSQGARVWIFDETTAPLSSKETAELFTIMKGLRERGDTVAMVTHRLDEVFAMADRITVLRDGEKVAEKTPDSLDPGELVRLMVGRDLASEMSRSTEIDKSDAGGSLTSGAPSPSSPSGFTAPPSEWSGRSDSDAQEFQDSASESSKGTAALEAVNLCGPGFSDVSLTLRPGEIVGLAGIVGAGRTELARALFGITRVTSGSVLIQGREVRIRNPREACRYGLGFVPEDRQHEGLLMPQSIVFNASLAALPGGLKSADRAVSAEVDRLHLVRRGLDQPVRQLSGGNQQKVVLAKWLMTRPKILILDEPTRGVDVGAKHEVHKLIRQLASEGLAVLLISSDLPEVLTLSSKVLVMREGRLVGEFAGEEATEQNVMAAALGQEQTPLA